MPKAKVFRCARAKDGCCIVTAEYDERRDHPTVDPDLRFADGIVGQAAVRQLEGTTFQNWNR